MKNLLILGAVVAALAISADAAQAGHGCRYAGGYTYVAPSYTVPVYPVFPQPYPVWPSTCHWHYTPPVIVQPGCIHSYPGGIYLHHQTGWHPNW